MLGLGRFRGRSVVLGVANAGMGLPSGRGRVRGAGVVALPRRAAGVACTGSHTRHTGVILAQTILALPVGRRPHPRGVPGPSPRAARSGPRVRRLAHPARRVALREARIGVLAAVIAASGKHLRGGGGRPRRRQLPRQRRRSQAPCSSSSTTPATIRTRPQSRSCCWLVILVLIGTLTVIQQRTGGTPIPLPDDVDVAADLGRDSRGRADDPPRQPDAVSA